MTEFDDYRFGADARLADIANNIARKNEAKARMYKAQFLALLWSFSGMASWAVCIAVGYFIGRT